MRTPVTHFQRLVTLFLNLVTKNETKKIALFDIKTSLFIVYSLFIYKIVTSYSKRIGLVVERVVCMTLLEWEQKAGVTCKNDTKQ